MTHSSLHLFSAFTTDPKGGNPAGVWIGDTLPTSEVMQRIAAEVGFSETAFVAPQNGLARTIRYYSPEVEVPFCGHATIATGVVLGQLSGEGVYHLATTVGEVPVAVSPKEGQWQASLTSVIPSHTLASDTLVSKTLSALNWQHDQLDPSIPPARAYAGAWHLILAVTQATRLADLNYDFEQLKALMLQEDLLTLQLIWQESPSIFHARNPFPVGGVIEDPATGAAAAALGGYLRDAQLISAPNQIVIRQGETMGRPSRLVVDIPTSGGIVVSGTAVQL
ncbi:PhzF family phenazine biosynthesis protein [Acaryochloris sp. IP29b_bin.148]|uniref:PhzF family phenazine biosynthesis protein n=1 Tax=Acaryochloris sp. IP29b_bin.148 TaxID=2969218 RepID=UPI002616E8B9|nr:PhzF family phenazine biosynthesis protein [Acaryochloris sp. IP29b_bin.148]